MSEKFLYVLLLLLVIIFVSQTFSFILSLSTMREGLDECLPSCNDVSYNYTTSTIPPCSKINILLLKPGDATAQGVPIINTFINSINNYLNNTYKITSLILPLQNPNINIQKGISSIQNTNQIKINKYFTDFSGMNFHSNQDILDNMILDPKFNTIINDFKYSLDQNNPNSTTKQNIMTNIEKYKTESLSPIPGYSSIYTKFLQDMSGMCLSFERKCPGYYTDHNLKTLIENELQTPTYYGSSSSFHKIAEYVFQSINGTLGKTST